MITAPVKAILLALFLFVPSVAPVRAGDEPPGQKEIVIDDDVDTFDADEPLVRHLGSRFRRGHIGVRLVEMTPELRAHYGAPRDAGVLVAGVEPDSAAAGGRISAA